MISGARREGAGRVRRGLALPLALASMVLVGILAASGLYLAAQDRRAGDNAALSERALAAAELAVGHVIEGWDGERAAALAVGSSWRRDLPVTGARAEAQVARLGPRTFWAVGEGRTSRGSNWSRRRVNAVLRIAVPFITVPAAVASAGPVEIAAGASIDGLASPACDTGEMAIPAAGVAVPALGDAAGDLRGVTGTPPLLAGAAGAGLPAPDSAAHDEIAARATVVLEGSAVPRPSRPSAAVEGCDWSDPANWGEPRAAGITACEAYRRVVHARGDVRLEGAHRGQGILLVDGDLSIPGRLEYRGLVIVRGRLDAAGEMRVEGGVLIGAASPTPSWLGAGSVVQYSRCEIDRALTAAGRPVFARERGWADLF